MIDPVEIVHDSGRVTTVPRSAVNTYARHGWRLASEPEPVEVPEPSIDGADLEVYERVTPRFDSLDES